MIRLAVVGLLGLAVSAEQYRPIFHFSPAKNWTNDPNGLVFYQGEYHLFYQHNPFGDTWGHMSWGHAVSRDLVTWTHLPVALAEENGVMIFSGSVVVDRRNTSGFCMGESCLIAIYTGHTKDNQSQHVAFSNDRGRMWTKYSGNPVLDAGMRDFRDPKVLWHEATRRWVMVVALPREHKVRFYGSPDLKRWTMLSEFGPAGATSGVWECPDLFPLAVDGDPKRVKWVLDVDLNPGGVAGGSGGQYFIGDFDGTRFVNSNPAETTLWQDYGKDFYASISFSDIPPADGRRIWLAWMSNWQYANVEPTSPFRGMMSAPRSLALKTFPEGIRLVQEPVVEMRKLRRRRVSVREATVEEVNRKLASFHSEAFEIVAEIERGPAAEAGFKVRRSANEETLAGFTAKDLFVDRARSGNVAFHKQFSGRHAGPLESKDRVRLHILVDRSSVELFGNDGRTVITDRIFPAAGSHGLAMYEGGGRVRVVAVDVWTLH